MNRLQEEILALIEVEGSLDFATYMDKALYHPELGYYSNLARIGWAGDYVTSPEIDPAFGQLWAKGVVAIWEACGRPSPFTITEVGPGEGGFARSLTEALVPGPLGEAFRLVLVERSEAGRERQRQALAGAEPVWVADIAEVGPSPGVVIAHEVLDNVPVHLVRRRGGAILEVVVGREAGALRFEEVPAEGEILALAEGLSLSDGQSAEVSPARDSLVRRTLAAVSAGAAIWIDYGLQDWDDHPAGTLACYSGSGADDDPLSHPGDKDITSHVDWTRVAAVVAESGAAPIGPILQREILSGLGARDLDAALKTAHRSALDEGRGADALRAISRRQALGVLLDRAGLGGLQTMIGFVGIEAPSPFWP